MVPADQVTCEELIRGLPALLDGELEGDLARHHRHLDACAHCLEIYRFERSLLDLLKDRLRRLDPPPGLAGRVRSLLAAVQDGGTGAV